MLTVPYREYSAFLRETFGCRVQKITVDAGLSCPNRDGALGVGGCVYCNPLGSGTGAARRSQSIASQLEAGKLYLGKRYKAKKFLAYFQSFSNTYAPLPVLKALYEEALAVPGIVGLAIGTRPDCVSDDVLDYLGELSRERAIWLEYGLQSSHDRTLALLRRGHGVGEFVDATLRARRRDIPVCAHVILGLPGETRAEMLDTARFLSSLEIQAVKIHLLYVVRGTILESWFRAGSYTCLTQEEYVALVGEFLSLLPPHVIIQRLTGDPHPEELVAPSWALRKRENLAAIRQGMASRELYQGKHYVGTAKESGRCDFGKSGH